MKPRHAAVLAYVLAIVIVVAACGGATATKPTATASPSPTASPGVAAYEHVKALSGGIGRRPAGSPAEVKARDYIIGQLRSYGYDVSVQEFEVPRKDKPPIRSANVIAVKPGSDRSWRIIVGAHYDSVKVGRGAFDNATGVGVLLEVAQRLAGRETPYTIEFVAFGAEELGYKGSKTHFKYFQGNVAGPPADEVAMVNLDSVATGDKLYVYSAKGANGWPRNETLAYAAETGLPLLTNPGLNPDYPRGTTGDWSDHRWFAKAGIPYLYFEATNWNIGEKDGYVTTRKAGEVWHTQDDTLAFIEKTFPGRMQRQLSEDVVLLEHFLTTEPETPLVIKLGSPSPAASGSPGP